MTEQIQQRLTDAEAAVREHGATGARVAELRESIKQARSGIVDLDLRADAADQAVARLEGMSLSRVITSLRGSRDDALARARAEAATSHAAVAQAQARLAELRRELEAATGRQRRLAGAAGDHAAALDERDRQLQEGDDQRARRLRELAGVRGRLLAATERTRRAVQAATVAAAALERLRELLADAGRWSAADTFLGGGVITSAVKHEAADEAATAARYVDERLAVLQQEVGNVPGADLALATSRFDGATRFVDIWVDNLVTDAEVRLRIKGMQTEVRRSAAAVAEVKARVEEQLARDSAALATADAERRTLLDAA